ncbi:MAG TPA: DnaJ domain-containing protein [Syntrophobacter fumaroxidans]|nr:DnaJ domain-containing protein [Syntrophobacter fumaroxidans]
MEKRDYYATLDIGRSESQSGIRDAYRRLAKRFHPDHAGAAATRAFQEISEAYAVLSDPEARRAYTEELARREAAPRVEIRMAGTTNVTGPPVSPVVSGGSKEALVPAEGLAGEGPFGSTFRTFIDEFFQPFPYGIGVREALELEVTLSREEAERGGVLPVPVHPQCPMCKGVRRPGMPECSYCLGVGEMDEATIALWIPPGVRHRTVMEIPLGTNPRSTLLVHIFIK